MSQISNLTSTKSITSPTFKTIQKISTRTKSLKLNRSLIQFYNKKQTFLFTFSASLLILLLSRAHLRTMNNFTINFYFILHFFPTKALFVIFLFFLFSFMEIVKWKNLQLFELKFVNAERNKELKIKKVFLKGWRWKIFSCCKLYFCCIINWTLHVVSNTKGGWQGGLEIFYDFLRFFWCH